MKTASVQLSAPELHVLLALMMSIADNRTPSVQLSLQSLGMSSPTAGTDLLLKIADAHDATCHNHRLGEKIRELVAVVQKMADEMPAVPMSGDDVVEALKQAFGADNVEVIDMRTPRSNPRYN